MRRLTSVMAMSIGLWSATASGVDVVIGPKTFRVPDGFLVEKVAGAPLVDRPIVADFDEAGRLFVADSSGSNDKVQQQLEDRPHRIVCLEDTNGDGLFDKSTVFADRMMFPEGAMWLDGSLYVSAPPSIWKLTDTDGDGVADQRQEWFQGKTLTGCANDLHGPYAGLDGRIYWCKGAFAPQTYERPGRKPLETRAAHIFRSKVDGTEIEPVMTGGMDNPVEVAFTPEGERIFTTTFLQQPGGGFRDGLIHALYGGLYGKVHDVIDNHPRTSPALLPPLLHMGPAAPSGLIRAESDALGVPDALYATSFNLRKVIQVGLKPKDGSFEPSSLDILVSDDHDFHPTDVLEDADGSLLVIDTGGWYKLCCPTSQLVKPDVLGAIYRVRRTGVKPPEDPRGLKLSWNLMKPAELTGLLDDPRPVVRKRAIAALGRSGMPAVPELSKVIQSSPSTRGRRNAVWAACRIDLPEARAAVRLGLNDPEASIRHVAAQAAGLWRDREAADRMAVLLGESESQVARASAEALGRIGDSSTIPALLKIAGRSTAWAVRHSATYALIEIDDSEATRAGLTQADAGITRAALTAIDQMESGKLSPAPLIRALNSPDESLRETAWWIAGRHPEWGEALSGFFRSKFGATDVSAVDLAELENRIASMARSESIRTLIGEELANGRNPLAVRLSLLRAMARSGLRDTPDSWVEGLTLALNEPSTIAQAVATARAIPIRPEQSRKLNPALLGVSEQEAQPAEVRLGSLAAIPGGLREVSPATFDFLIGQLAGDRPVSARTTSADVFAKAALAPDQFSKLAIALGQSGPLEAGRLLDAFDKAQGEVIGGELVAALLRSPARSTLRVETLKPRLARFGPGTAESAVVLFRAIEIDTADRSQHLESLLANLSGGDIRRGQQVFNGTKAACATCHSIGYVGGKLGPDLTKIGQVRAERDLLEAIVYPSASFVRSYEPVSIATTDGRTFSGILKKDAPDEVIVDVAADKEERIPRDLIEEIIPGTISVMPAGLDKQLTPAELVDLVTFLRASR
ncbi:PVC-type heme-binding CxxCH protein [Tundrisphaera lichenicola]|uniref:PVC-type heme-binding CxxCH protein n=1 Tax=Tundrisphaera lichenicola TaxID=2029860 RepID=UPI003EBB462E